MTTLSLLIGRDDVDFIGLLHLRPVEELGAWTEACHVALVGVDDLGQILRVNRHFESPIARKQLMSLCDLLRWHSARSALSEAIKSVFHLNLRDLVNLKVQVVFK